MNHKAPHPVHYNRWPCTLPDDVLFAIDTLPFRQLKNNELGKTRQREQMYDPKLGAPGWKAQGAFWFRSKPTNLFDTSLFGNIHFRSVVVALDDCECVSVSNVYPGATSDSAIYLDSEASKLLAQNNVFAIGDSAYENCPCIVSAAPTGHTPIADPENWDLRIEQDLHSHRAVVEHFNSRLHKWQILDERIFREDRQTFALYFFVCAQLTELKRRFKVSLSSI